MDDLIREKVISKLSLRDGCSHEEALSKLMSMPKHESKKLIAEALKSGSVSMYNIVKQTVESKGNVPLVRIRDNDERGPFDDSICMGCGRGIEAVNSTNFLKCSRCKAVKYCNKSCQKLDWIGKGQGPTKSRKHKDLCSEFVDAQTEYENHPTAGPSLRTYLFRNWANQHNEDGAFFKSEFLARINLLGGEAVGFWAVPDVMHVYHAAGKDCRGFQNGQMLLKESFPTLAEGWTSTLKKNEYPPSNSPETPVAKKGLKGWEDYMTWRKLSTTSVAPLLLTNVLTVYQMINHELKLPQKQKNISVCLLGVEKELNQIPLFAELAYLLPGVDLKLTMVSSGAEAICQEALSLKEKTLLTKGGDYVLDVSDPKGGGRIRVKINRENEFFHDVPIHPSPDAVLALNAGLGSYPTWEDSIHQILRRGLRFSMSEQTISTLRFVEHAWLPSVVENANNQYPQFPPLSVPKFDIKLNPFHGIVGRDVGAVLVPNINNGYLMTWFP
jgi:hypothetical protein